VRIVAVCTEVDVRVIHKGYPVNPTAAKVETPIVGLLHLSAVSVVLNNWLNTLNPSSSNSLCSSSET